MVWTTGLFHLFHYLSITYPSFVKEATTVIQVLDFATENIKGATDEVITPKGTNTSLQIVKGHLIEL